MKLAASTQFQATQEQISRILDAYDVELTDFKLADTGIENCTIFVSSKSRRFVVRVYRQHKKSDDDILQEIEFSIFLGKNGLQVANVLVNKLGQYITHLEEDKWSWQAILMDHMPGAHANHYSDQLITDMALAQATMHNLATAYPAKRDTQEIHVLQETHFINMIPDRNQLDEGQRAFVDRAEEYIVTMDGKLPSGLCHLDFDNGNILSENGRITSILDFDDLTQAPYTMCLAYTLWDVAFDGGIAKANEYIDHYMKHRPLNSLEKSFIPPIMLFRHYVIGCKDIVNNQMADELFKRYLDLESELLG